MNGRGNWFESEMYLANVRQRIEDDRGLEKKTGLWHRKRRARFARGRCDTRSRDRSVHLIPVHADTVRAHGLRPLATRSSFIYFLQPHGQKSLPFAYVTARRSNREFVGQIARNLDKADVGKSCRVRMSDSLNFCSCVIGDVAQVYICC